MSETREIAWLDRRAERAADRRPLLEDRTWRWWRAHHLDQWEDDRRRTMECTRLSARRSWLHTAVWHRLAQAEIRRGILEGRINPEAMREVRRG